MSERKWWAMMFGSGRPQQGDALTRDLEDRLMAVRGSLALAITRLLAARRANAIGGDDRARIIDEVIDLLERARLRSEL
jgi:hypothetical protein